VPYIGPIVAAGFPVALAAAIDPGWGMALETLALFLFVEPIIGQGVEPWLYGHNTGISPIAVVISATFWWWLWGTVGRVLSTPLTVCLAVLGRHVERLAFLDIIFGDDRFCGSRTNGRALRCVTEHPWTYGYDLDNVARWPSSTTEPRNES
jgi:predicted PurR-regulated permease PerM